MCEQLSDMDKEIVAVVHKHDPAKIPLMFQAAMMAGKCQVTKHIAENYLNDFEPIVQPKVTMLAKMIDLIEAAKVNPAAKKTLSKDIADLLMAEISTRPLGNSPLERLLDDLTRVEVPPRTNWSAWN